MSKKAGFGFGLFLGLTGAAAYFAFKRLDPAKQKELVTKANNAAHDLKDRAVDYAFYANDALSDARESLGKKTSEVTDNAKQAFNSATDKINDRFNEATDDDNDESNTTQFHTAADRLRDELHNTSEDAQDDIVVNADDVFKNDKKVETFYPNGTSK
ncbi:YtxH domain-containing protein [Lactobacillus sp. Sy-1]|uniref:YtxH domain-containing protein n=1 Tax=Lactobacillus sp. Sy-1 TaxID=2109645 RepID=UPI001C5885DD|nr:YtxH domain-containing protein [Lactobacillus sp. Sy-1]MBW1605772.1 YtxH domain-containing protein [Lactobacillus sp. Sy-1]